MEGRARVQVPRSAQAAAVLAARYREDRDGFSITLDEFESPEEAARGFMHLADLLLRMLAKEHGVSREQVAAIAARFLAGEALDDEEWPEEP